MKWESKSLKITSLKKNEYSYARFGGILSLKKKTVSGKTVCLLTKF